jgi:hypothetical protein
MTKPRARDLGIHFEGATGQYNAITDVKGVEVGYSTIIEGDSARTGVTIIHPRGKANHDPVYAAWFPFNGNGEMTGTAWVEEGGFLEGPIGITNTHSVGIVRDTIIQWQVEKDAMFQKWSCPLVAETADGWLNNMNAFYVKPEHVREALENAESGLIEEGNVWAVLAAGVSSMVLGGLWYSPVLFGKAWSAASGVTEAQQKSANMAKVMGTAFVLAVIGAAVFAMFLGPRPALGFATAAGLSAGLCWVAGSFGINYLFEQRSLRLFLINGGYHTVQYTLIGAVLGLWH